MRHRNSEKLAVLANKAVDFAKHGECEVKSNWKRMSKNMEC